LPAIARVACQGCNVERSENGHSFGNWEVDRSNPLGIEGRMHKLPVRPVALALT
jgi:hypothetical protein